MCAGAGAQQANPVVSTPRTKGGYCELGGHSMRSTLLNGTQCSIKCIRALFFSILALSIGSVSAFAQNASALQRPPAVPLVTHDPYFSIWSMSDRLTDQNTKHWTGTEQPLSGLVRIDGALYRYMG